MPQIHEPGNKDNDTKILPVDSDVQEMVNTPPIDPDGFTKEEEDFLRMIMMMFIEWYIYNMKIIHLSFQLSNPHGLLQISASCQTYPHLYGKT